MIYLSRAAISEVKRRQRTSPGSLLRLGVQPGGCSSFYYTLESVASAQPEDLVWHCDDLQVVVDPQSLVHLKGLTLDYSEDLMGGGFRFDNPNAAHHCECGTSFAPIESAKR